MEVVLSIVKIQYEHRAVIGIGVVPEVASRGELIYQDIQDAENTAHARTVIEGMKEKAKNWVRKNGIPFVFNLDFDPYP